MKIPALFVAIFLCACAPKDRSKMLDEKIYEGCYYGNGLAMRLSEGVLATADGRYVYRVSPKKVGIVLVSNFFVETNDGVFPKIYSSEYDKFYIISEGGISLPDAQGRVFRLKKSDAKMCNQIDKSTI